MIRSSRLFVTGALLVLLALCGVTWMLLDLEHRERSAKASARREQLLGQALLRMDLALAPLIAGEAARWQPMRTGANTGFTPATPFLRLYFEVRNDGSLASPQDPAVLAQLANAVPASSLENALVTALPGTNPSQMLSNDLETFEGRSQLVQNVGGNAIQAQTAFSGTPVEVGAFSASFVRCKAGSEQLFFLRKVLHSKAMTMQGIWAHWPELKRWLLDQVADLLPGVDLVPASTGSFTHRLVTVPLTLVPGPGPEALEPATGSVATTLIVTWIAVLLALGVVGWALRAAMDLGARRALFVSAVTHELRTPLTTFRMYSQMLADGMVPDSARPEYLETLKRESERLARVVESVLLYSRLEDGRQSAHSKTVPAHDLLVSVVARVRQRAAEAGRDLAHEIRISESVLVHVDPQAVEQILLNLVENSLKFAPGGRILVLGAERNGEVSITVADSGPGVQEAEAERIFRPFERGARQDTVAIPGLGLGLAIARGLARAMGGDLRLRQDLKPGATFELTLPTKRNQVSGAGRNSTVLAFLAMLACSEPPSPAVRATSTRPSSVPETTRRYDAHLRALQEKLPNAGFAVVVEPPFVVVAEGGAETARRWASGTVRWAVTKLKAEYFASDPDTILDVWLFDGDASYRRYTKQVFDDTPSTPYGYYSRAHGALIMNIATGGGTLVHEIVHPFVAANFPRCPAWFNEGLGSLYEQSSERDGRIVGLTNWRLRGLQEAIRAGRTRPLRDLMATTTSEFYGDDSGLHYAMARYLLFWLQEQGHLKQYWAAFVKSADADPTGIAAFAAISGITDWPEFQKDWEAYALKLRFP